MNEAAASLSASAVPEIRLDARIRRVGETLVVAGPGREALELSDAAALAFRQIDGSRTIDQITAVIADRYGANHELVLVDIAEALTDLRDGGVVTFATRREGPPSERPI